MAGATGHLPGGASCTLAPAGPDSASCSVSYRPATTEGSHVIKGAYGGSALHDTSAGSDSITVTKRSTSTTIACPASLALHETGSCSATVSDTDAGDKAAPTGSVTFTLDPSSVAGATGTFPGGASCTLAPAGPDSASCSVSYRPATTEGSHVIKGAYGGSALHDTSAGSDSITVTKRSTSTTIACPASLALHETGSCSATVSDTDAGDKAAPTGSVTFTLDPSSVAGATGTFPGGASCTLAPAGPDSASCSVSYRPATTEGSHVIKGAYGGSALHDTSAGSDSITVTKRSTSTTIACPASLALHETGSCSATVSDTDAGDKAAPTGSVTFTLDPSSVAGATGTFPGGASCTLAPAGPDSASCSVSYRPATTEGSHVIKGAYGGSALHDTSAGSDSITVTKRSTSTTIACPASLALHETGSCSATVSDTDAGDKAAPTGSVTFTLDPSSVAGATGTFPGGASCTLAPAGPDSASCSVSYRPATTEGSHVIKGAYGGSALHDTSAGSDSITVTKRSTSTTIACPASLALHETGSCSATVSDTDAGDKAAPTGSVTFTLDPSSVAGATGTFPGGASCTLAPAGPDSASCSVSYRPATTEGSHVIKGAYGGSALHDTSAGSDSINVTKRSTSTTIACPASLALHETGSCSATVSDTDAGDKAAPTGSVTFTLDPSSVAGATGTFPGGASCTLAPAGPDSASCSVSYRPATTEGSHVIKGAYGGSALHDTSAGSDSITVTKRSTSTSVSCVPAVDRREPEHDLQCNGERHQQRRQVRAERQRDLLEHWRGHVQCRHGHLHRAEHLHVGSGRPGKLDLFRHLHAEQCEFHHAHDHRRLPGVGGAHDQLWHVRRRCRQAQHDDVRCLQSAPDRHQHLIHLHGHCHGYRSRGYEIGARWDGHVQLLQRDDDRDDDLGLHALAADRLFELVHRDVLVRRPGGRHGHRGIQRQ